MVPKLDLNINRAAPTVVNLRCPVCNHVGAFHGRADNLDLTWNQLIESGKNIAELYAAGFRICPNTECNTLVFVILKAGTLFKSYPPEVIDFDSTNLPQKILDTLEEAIRSHSVECYKAAAIMIRRVLEELCEDQGASGKDLKARLSVLGQRVVVPKELLDASDELRLLGNDAAHVSAKNYDAIGKEESTLAIELAKEP